MSGATPGIADRPSLLTEHDIYLFKSGRHARLYRKLGAHCFEHAGRAGVLFAVWAPNAETVSVIGDFNDWHAERHPLQLRADGSGIWEGFVGGVVPGARYKFRLRSRINHYTVDKADPFARQCERAPATASIVAAPDYVWNDAAWLAQRAARNALDAAIAIYELHLGSWRRANGALPTYRQLAEWLPDYVADLGFTHVELMPLTEHPFYGSWGYQCTGYFAPTARYGEPADCMALIDALHQRGIGVVLDWVPSHFPSDEHGLAFFDGSHLFEHADPRQGFHPDWNSSIFNYGRHEVRAFLLSSALFWLDCFHIDALRVDAVASMLYLDYSRAPGEWLPNAHGGRENLDAITFLREFNEAVYRDYPDVQTIAEESTAWPQVSRPTWVGGLGFGLKWNMGWMHDSLAYFRRDPIHRKFHHDELTFSLCYAFAENFVLPLSHDEVVHGKGSLIGKLPGDDWQRFAQLRLLLAYLYTHPGKKLLFMGAELAQWREWSHERELDWGLLDQPPHQGVQRCLRDLNRLYRELPALHRGDCDARGYQWIDPHGQDSSTASWLRLDPDGPGMALIVANFTPVSRFDFHVGVPRAGVWQERFNGDARDYGGSGVGNFGAVATQPRPAHGHPQSVTVSLPPLALLCFEAPAPR